MVVTLDAPIKLEVRAKQNEKQYPEVRTVTCHCRSKHKAGCGCLSVGFIRKAHTDFSSILMECHSQEEFTRRISALPNHARDEHEWDGGGVISTHCGFALVNSVKTKTR